MSCPECRSKRVVNENTGKISIFRRIGGDFNNTCKNCGCVWIIYGHGGLEVTKHGKFKRGKKYKMSEIQEQFGKTLKEAFRKSKKL